MLVASPRRTASIGTFRADPLYPEFERAVAAISEKGKVVAPVDVLVVMGVLALGRVADWRRGRIPYLEQVIDDNLMRLLRLLRIVRFLAHDLNLEPSIPVYLRRGRGPRQSLRITRSGSGKLEEAYAGHFLWPGRGLVPIGRSEGAHARPAASPAKMIVAAQSRAPKSVSWAWPAGFPVPMFADPASRQPSHVRR
jgi:hypothetical protein